jgi:hypothetical protein
VQRIGESEWRSGGRLGAKPVGVNNSSIYYDLEEFGREIPLTCCFRRRS